MRQLVINHKMNYRLKSYQCRKLLMISRCHKYWLCIAERMLLLFTAQQPILPGSTNGRARAEGTTNEGSFL